MGERMAGSGHVYRIDRFAVPAAARDEFLARVRETHEVLRAQPGFVGDMLLEQSGGPGEFNLVTIAEWESGTAFDEVKAAVGAMHAARGFSPPELMARLGIRGDIGTYQRIGG